MSQKPAKTPIPDDKPRTASPANEKKKVAVAEKAVADKAPSKSSKNTGSNAEKPKAATNAANAEKPKAATNAANEKAKDKETCNEAAKKDSKAKPETSAAENDKPAASSKVIEKTLIVKIDTDKKLESKEDKVAKKAEEPKPNEQQNVGNKQVNNPVPQQVNGTKTNGVSDVVLGTNGSGENGLHIVSGSDIDDDYAVVVDQENDNDELFPELTYDDGSDNENFEPTTPELGALSRSMTRRSQTKPTRTPETPRPSKPTESNGDEAKLPEINEIVEPEKSEKILRLRERQSVSPRRLRSDDRATPEINVAATTTNGDAGNIEKENQGTDEVGAKASNLDEPSKTVKTDTNFSKSRIKVSPYRKTRTHDHTSLIVNCSDANSTMDAEMSVSEAPSSTEDTFTNAYRSIKGRRSYRNLGEPKITRKPAVVMTASGKVTPVVHVVGRKRTLDGDPPLIDSSKRMRLLDRVVSPLAAIIRPRTMASSTPLPTRHILEPSSVDTNLNISQDIEVSSDEPKIENDPSQSLIITEKLETISDLPIPAEANIGDTKQRCFVM